MDLTNTLSSDVQSKVLKKLGNFGKKITLVHSDSNNRLNGAVARGKHLNQLCGQPRWEIVLGHECCINFR